MPQFYDAAVIGAGPAGSLTALALAQKGWKVALFEKQKLGRDRVCGGFLGPEIPGLFQKLGISGVLSKAGAVPVDEIMLSDPHHEPLIVRAFEGGAFGVDRARFDRVLAEEAIGAGVHFFEETEASPRKIKEDFFELALGEKGMARAAKVVIATGRRRPGKMTEKTFFALKTRYENLADMDGRVVLHFVRLGHVGFNLLGENRYTMCLYIERSRIAEAGGDMDYLIEILARENPAIANHLRSARRIGPWSGCPAQADFRESFFDGQYFYSGDAVAMANPIIGGGLSLAAGSASLLGDILAQARKQAWDNHKTARFYAASWYRDYWKKILFGRLLGLCERSKFTTKAIFSFLHLSPSSVQHLVKLSRPHIRLA